MADDAVRDIPEPNVRAAYAYLADAVRAHGKYPLLNDLWVSEYAMKHGPQVIDRRAAGKCLGCGHGPPEDGYFTCWQCVVNAEEVRRG